MIKGKLMIQSNHNFDHHSLYKPVSQQKINKQKINLSAPRHFVRLLQIAKERQKNLNKTQLLKAEIHKLFPQDNHKIFVRSPKRSENLGYKVMIKRLKKSKDLQYLLLNVKNKKNKKIQPLQPNSFMTAKKIKPKLQIEEIKKCLLNQDNSRYNSSTSMDWKYKNMYQKNTSFKKRPDTDLAFYKSMTSYLLQRKKKAEQLVCDLRPKINKNPELFEDIKPWDQKNQFQDLNDSRNNSRNDL